MASTRELVLSLASGGNADARKPSSALLRRHSVAARFSEFLDVPRSGRLETRARR